MSLSCLQGKGEGFGIYYFEEIYCWTMVIRGNHSSFCTKQITCSHQFTSQPSILSCGVRSKVDCHMQPPFYICEIVCVHSSTMHRAENQHSQCQCPLNIICASQCMALSEWGWLLCAASWKYLFFSFVLCASCIIQRYVRFTVIT